MTRSKRLAVGSVAGAVVAVIGIGSMIACDTTDPVPKDRAVEAGRNLTYFRDERTGLCFAAVQSTSYYGYMVTSIANVPCEPRVVELTR